MAGLQLRYVTGLTGEEYGKVETWRDARLERCRRTTAGYAHLADGHLVEAADKVGSLIVVAMRGTGSEPRHSPGGNWWWPPFIGASAPHHLIAALSITPWSTGTSAPLSFAASRRIASRLTSKPGSLLTAEVRRQPMW